MAEPELVEDSTWIPLEVQVIHQADLPEGEDALEVKVIRGQFVDQQIQDRIRIPVGEGIAGRVMETGQVLIGKETLGVINLVNRTGSREFMQDDLDLMTSIASQAAVTMPRGSPSSRPPGSFPGTRLRIS